MRYLLVFCDKTICSRLAHKLQYTLLFGIDYRYEFDYQFDFLAFEPVMLTTRSSAVLETNRRTATMFHSTTTLQTPAKNLVVPKIVLVVRLVLVVKFLCRYYNFYKNVYSRADAQCRLFLRISTTKFSTLCVCTHSRSVPTICPNTSLVYHFQS